MTVSVDKPIICPVLIGRDHHLAALHLLMEHTRSGQGQVLLLCGEAGIGKSRLVTEFKTEAVAQGFQALQGHCFPTDLSCPYAPLLDLLRSLFLHTPAARLGSFMPPFARELTPLLPELLQFFPELATLPPLPSLEPEQEKGRLFAALARFFLQQAATHPLLFIVEDVHWSDETSLEFLLYLARHCGRSPLLILLTYRSDEIRPALSHWLAELDREHLAQEMALTHLTFDETDAMLRAIFDRECPAELLDAIYTLTEGNPFFIEELLKSLIATGEISPTRRTWDRKPLNMLHIPRSIQDAVQQRSNQLSESARQLLVLAAVAGRHFDFAVLQQVRHHDEQQLLSLMKEFIGAQLVVEESAEQFAFRHAMTQQAVYTQLLVRERKVLHRRIGEAMEQLYSTTLDRHLADLAYHFSESGAWEKALEYAQRAGEKAQRLYAPRTAVEQFTRALEAAHHLALAPSPPLYRARGQAYETLGAFDQARADYEQAREAAHTRHDSAGEWQGLLDLGFLWTGRDYERAGAFFRHALDLAQTLAEPKLHAQSLNRLGNWHMHAEQPREALHYHQEALVTFRKLDDPHGIAETLDLLGTTSAFSGDLVQSASYYKQAVELFRELDERQGLVSSLGALIIQGGSYTTVTQVPVPMSLAEVLQEGERALKLAGEMGQRSAEACVLSEWGLCLGLRGAYAHALECAQASLTIAEDINHRQWMVGAHLTLGVLYLDLLALPVAHAHLEQALRLSHEIGSLWWMRNASAFLAAVSIRLHDLAQAQSLLTSACGLDTPAQTQVQRLVRYMHAELALAQGRPDQALAIANQLIASAANVADEGSIPHLSHLRGKALMMLHQVAEAESALQAARVGAMRQGARSLLWHIALDLGNLFHAELRDEEAGRAVTFAQELIEELAAPIPDQSLRDQFLHQATALIPHAQPRSPRRAAKRAFGGLTEREREVASLIAQGKANREIADILVVNYRTVEKHIENMLSKLGFASRTQIAVWAAEKGLLEKGQSQC